jgi:hypothetical protein
VTARFDELVTVVLEASIICRGIQRALRSSSMLPWSDSCFGA